MYAAESIFHFHDQNTIENTIENGTLCMQVSDIDFKENYIAKDTPPLNA